MGNVRRVITEDLPDDVEGFYRREGWKQATVFWFLMWLCSAADVWHILWIAFMGEGR